MLLLLEQEIIIRGNVGRRLKIEFTVTDRYVQPVVLHVKAVNPTLRSRCDNTADKLGFRINRELYAFKDFRNYKLSKLMQRIPLMIEYVIREYLTPAENSHSKVTVHKNKVIRKDIDEHEIAA